MSVEHVQERADNTTTLKSAWLALHGGFSMATILVMFLVLGLFFRMATSVLEDSDALYVVIGCCLAALLISLAIIVPGKLKASIEAMTCAILAIASAGLLYAIIFQMPEINEEFSSFAFRVDHLYVLTGLYYLIFPYITIQVIAIVFQCGNIARAVASRGDAKPGTWFDRMFTRVDIGVASGCIAIAGLLLGLLPYLTAKDVFLLGVCWMFMNPAVMAIAGKKTGRAMMDARSAVEPSRSDLWKPWIAASSLILLALCLIEFENKISPGNIAMLVTSLPWFCTGIAISLAAHYGLSIAGIKAQPWTFWIALAVQAATSFAVLRDIQVLVTPGYFIIAGITFGWILAQVFMVAWPINDRKLARGGLAMLLLLLGVLVIGLNILSINFTSFITQGYSWIVIAALGMATIFWVIGFLAWIVPRHRKAK